ncbi:hypothetical protein BDY24DRAFT_442784 [Mrakia frigida]|uniref:F-box protein n=1 Tax=Mrakia frigida TaxID=29902 RepID=UPI003FCBF52F
MSPPIASPPSLQALPSLPWETVEHIYSFCDQETLVSLSLVSFGSWELAGPILYEKVEITTLDGLVFALLHRRRPFLFSSPTSHPPPLSHQDPLNRNQVVGSGAPTILRSPSFRRGRRRGGFRRMHAPPPSPTPRLHLVPSPSPVPSTSYGHPRPLPILRLLVTPALPTPQPSRSHPQIARTSGGGLVRRHPRHFDLLLRTMGRPETSRLDRNEHLYGSNPRHGWDLPGGSVVLAGPREGRTIDTPCFLSR